MRRDLPSLHRLCTPAPSQLAAAKPHRYDNARIAEQYRATPSVTTTQFDMGSGYNQELERVLKASQGLRGAIQGLVQKQGPQRTGPVAMAHQAPNVTNQAMSQLPPEMRIDPTLAANSKSGSGATGSIGTQPDNPNSVEALQLAQST